MKKFLPYLLLALVYSCTPKEKNSEEDAQDSAQADTTTAQITSVTNQKLVAQLSQKLGGGGSGQSGGSSWSNVQDYAALLVQRYISRDTTAFREIMGIYDRADDDSVSSLYSALEEAAFVGFDIPEDAFRKQILKDVGEYSYCMQATTIASSCDVPGWVARMEKVLVSGKSCDEIEMLSSLSREGSSIKSLDYLLKKLKIKSWKEVYLTEGMECLASFAQEGTPEVRRKAAAAAVNFYKTNFVDEEHFESFRNGKPYSNPAGFLYEAMLESGDKVALKAAAECIAQDFSRYEALEAIIRLDLPKGKQLLKETMTSAGGWNPQYVSLFADVYSKSKDPTVARDLLACLESANDPTPHDLCETVTTLIRMDSSKTKTFIGEYVKSDSLKEKLMSAESIFSITPEEMEKDFISAGLLDAPFPKAVLDSAKAEFKAGERKNISYTLGLKTGRVGYLLQYNSPPVNYEDLMWEFRKIASPDLQGLEFVQEAEELTSGTYDYSLFAVFNGKAYIGKPADKVDYYDVPFIRDFINRILSEAGSDYEIWFQPDGTEMYDLYYVRKGEAEKLIKKYNIN